MKKELQHYIAQIKAYEYQLLLFKPWVWETKIIQSAAFALIYNALFFYTLFYLPAGFFDQSIPSALVSLLSGIGLLWWFYQSYQHDLTRIYGIITSKATKWQFFLYLMGTALWLLPCLFPHLSYLTSRDISSLSLATKITTWLGLSFYIALLHQLTKLIRIKKMLYTLSILAIIGAGFSFLVTLFAPFIFLIPIGLIIFMVMAVNVSQSNIDDKKRVHWFYTVAVLQLLIPFMLYLFCYVGTFLPTQVVVLALKDSVFVPKDTEFDIGIHLNTLAAFFLMCYIYTKELQELRKFFLIYQSRPDDV